MPTSEAPAVSLRSAFNAAAPANHLPTELVIQILTSGAWSHWWELVALTHICQHWRAVALGTPQLWGDAARSGLKERTTLFGRKSWEPVFLFLPALLARSAPGPIKFELSHPMTLTQLAEHEPAVSPYFARLCHLSVDVQYPGDVAEVLRIVPSHFRNLQVLHILHANRPEGFVPITLGDVPSWKDMDLPHLHTLTIPGLCFTRSIAVPSLKTLILSDGPRSHGIFLAALARCSLALESLTLLRWAHPDRESSDVPASTTRVVQLPNLRFLKVAVRSKRPSALLFAGLSLPPTVAIHFDWRSNYGNLCELLPKHLVGLHTAPYFDSMYLHLFDPLATGLHCFVGDVERLSVREKPRVDPVFPKGRTFSAFLTEHRYPAVTRLAIDMDMDMDEPDARRTSVTQWDRLPAFVAALPGLRRLDLLGKNVRHLRRDIVKAFLQLDMRPPSATGAESAAGTLKTLGYVCEVPERLRTEKAVGYVDGLRAQLDELAALLAAHLAAGGPRLDRLELCIAYSARPPRPPPQAYPSVCGTVRPSTELTVCLSSTYLPRFAALVDEVVFVGDVKRRGPGWRVLDSGVARVSQVTGPKRLRRGGTGTARKEL
ncbi:hypothetical protein GSI_13376 [Ganoderma sinense ZZ0214-1]|uniref:Uncharacterized protein n=1 Tax=Ganoderma sinense ZZ0214-1 TaxID=1077348 RepID=A0A2G8RVD6_9APHY|nr:hypothetical protein GSI_13376 [Ganoderma sinense ZZ0214-1]